MRVDAETSKAQLRKRIRSERAARAAARAGLHAESSGAEYVSPVAESAWQVVKGLRPDLDLTGCSMLAYAALAGEPDLDPTIDRFLAHGGTVYLPVVTSVGHPLMFGAVTDSMSTLEPRGKWGIREPSPSLTASALLTAEVAPDLIFVPALGFGPGGARLGNGGGFYDRTFGPQGEVPLSGAEDEEPLADGARTDGERTEPASIYGVCFSSELNLPGLTIEPWDLQISQAVTDHGVHTLD